MSIHRVYVGCYGVGIQLTLFNQVRNPLSAVTSPAAAVNDVHSTKYDPPVATTTSAMEISPFFQVRLAYVINTAY